MNEAFFHLQEEKQNRILYAGITEFAAKSYSEANTDVITKTCEISKGLLFHYFGNKKEFYLFCVEQAARRLTVSTPVEVNGDFYEILFSGLDSKIRLCKSYPNEMHLLNMASRENNTSVMDNKNRILQNYMAKARKESVSIYQKALSTLSLKEPGNKKTVDALVLYTNSIINQYLVRFQNTPDAFFEQIDSVKQELKEYLSFFLNGICE